MTRPAVALLLVVGLAVGGCAEGDPGADGDVESLGGLVPAPLADELTEAGRCDDGRVWAATDDGSLAVVVDLGIDPAGEQVLVIHDEEPCSARGGSKIVSGDVGVGLDGCTLSINGLEAADGTTFGATEIDLPCD